MQPLKTSIARFAIAGIAGIGGMTLPLAAQAAQYEVAGSVEFVGNGFTVVKDSYNQVAGFSISRQVLVTEDDPPTRFDGRAGSGADGYGLHASTYVGASYVFDPDYSPPVLGGDYVGRAYVGVYYNDVIIFGPAGAAPVQTAINFHLSGAQILGTHVPGPGGFSSNVTSVSLQIAANSNGASGVYNQFARNGVPQPVDERGMLVGFDGNANVQTPLFTLPVNTPFTLYMALNTLVDVSVDYREGFAVSSLADFGSTLSFATDRPVFDLPAGYSVNSAEAGIADNAFTSPVPEPGSAVLATFGLLAVGCWVRRRSIRTPMQRAEAR